MEPASNGDRVEVSYVVHYGEKKESIGPQSFTLGKGEVLPCLEEAVMGMRPGETKREEVPAERAFGRHREDLVVDVPKERLERGERLKVGDRLDVKASDGSVIRAIVTGLSDDAVTLDANPRLAGKDLVFVVQLLGIEKQQ